MSFRDLKEIKNAINQSIKFNLFVCLYLFSSRHFETTCSGLKYLKTLDIFGHECFYIEGIINPFIDF